VEKEENRKKERKNMAFAASNSGVSTQTRLSGALQQKEMVEMIRKVLAKKYIITVLQL